MIAAPTSRVDHPDASQLMAWTAKRNFWGALVSARVLGVRMISGGGGRSPSRR